MPLFFPAESLLLPNKNRAVQERLVKDVKIESRGRLVLEDSHFECEWVCVCVCYTSGGQLFQSVTPDAK